MRHLTFAVLLGLLGATAPAQESGSFDRARQAVQRQLQEAVDELNQLQQQIAAEKIPLSKRLNELEGELSGVRAEYQQKSRLLDTRALDLNNLRDEIKRRRDEATYLSNLFGEYLRNFETRVHVAETQRYADLIGAAKLAPENGELSQEQVYAAQVAVLSAALGRAREALGGVRFEGTAVADGLVREGTYAVVGPAALFRSNDGRDVGTAEQPLGSVQPTVIGFTRPEDTQAASALVETGAGTFPLDPTLGNAHKIAATDESFWEHVQKGGPVMVPIFALAAAALLVALLKWLSMITLREPTPARIKALLDAVAQRDEQEARARARALPGPIGSMLAAGVDHLREPRELIEEVMYEQVLTTRLRLNGFLPFIAICAASAPLLGLLGTVTGIINTFKLITVFGSGDVKMLSGGISEALITTKFGLIVAIPSLLLHAYLSRKARGMVGHMERAAVAFINQISKTPLSRLQAAPMREPMPAGTPDPALVRAQVSEILNEMLGPLTKDNGELARGTANGA